MLRSGDISRTANMFKVSQKNIKRWLDKTEAQYCLEYYQIEKELENFIKIFQLKNKKNPSDKEVQTEAKNLCIQNNTKKFNKIWFQEFLKKQPYKVKSLENNLLLESK